MIPDVVTWSLQKTKPMINVIASGTLIQPVLAKHPEPGHDRQDVLPFEAFMKLLKEEEDYFEGDQHKTRLMITRLRKIFYDRWGWNSQLIRGTWHIRGRYKVEVVPASREDAGAPIKKLRRFKQNSYAPKMRLITYRSNDRIYGNTRVGKVPEIYQKNHQELLLPEGYYCDIAHVLAGLDAANHNQVVSPMPVWLSFLDKLFPHVDTNIDIVTWLGDIASSSADFLFDYLRNGKPPGPAQQQHYINVDAPGSDMLGDIDAYVIRDHYPVAAKKGKRLTGILNDYYLTGTAGSLVRAQRFRLFCTAVGLRGWNGKRFSNESAWLQYYTKQLRDNISFQLFSLNEGGIKSIITPLKVWMNGYRDILQLELLLKIFLKATGRWMEQEMHRSHE